MKEGIHPNYQHTTITCAYGNLIETGSTKKDIKVEVCSKYQPFFTGKQQLVGYRRPGRQVQQEVWLTISENKTFGLTGGPVLYTRQ